jgi:hypothetical protein
MVRLDRPTGSGPCCPPGYSPHAPSLRDPDLREGHSYAGVVDGDPRWPAPQLTTVYLDDADRTVYYLAFDLLLARAPVLGPIRDGVAVTGSGTVVERMSSDRRADAYHAHIRSELLRRLAGTSWQPESELERARAEELAEEAELSEPPGLDRRCFTLVVLKADSS